MNEFTSLLPHSAYAFVSRYAHSTFSGRWIQNIPFIHTIINISEREKIRRCHMSHRLVHIAHRHTFEHRILSRIRAKMHVFFSNRMIPSMGPLWEWKLETRNVIKRRRNVFNINKSERDKNSKNKIEFLHLNITFAKVVRKLVKRWIFVFFYKYGFSIPFSLPAVLFRPPFFYLPYPHFASLSLTPISSYTYFQ